MHSGREGIAAAAAPDGKMMFECGRNVEGMLVSDRLASAKWLLVSRGQNLHWEQGRPSWWAMKSAREAVMSECLAENERTHNPNSVKAL
jgi:hypothetical protein